jgi:hypothetical protein
MVFSVRALTVLTDLARGLCVFGIRKTVSNSLTNRAHHPPQPQRDGVLTHDHPGPSRHDHGMARSSILRAIKRGALSGTRQDDGTWLVDPAELARAFPVNAQAALQGAHPDPVAAVRLEAAQQRIADLERALSDMRGERDEWKVQAQRLALPNAHPARQDGQPDAPLAQPDQADVPNSALFPMVKHQRAQPAVEPSPLLRTWRWLRTTG